MNTRIAERRRRTTDEVVAVATQVMSESGAAGLSLGEVAKRMGMRTPSLYGYFDSRSALCDEIFRRGWVDLTEVMRPEYDRVPAPTAAGLHRQMTRSMRTFVGWSLEHSAAAELMFWRPVAGWRPSPEAYAPAVELLGLLGACLSRMQESGALSRDARVDEMVDVLVLMTTGVITQQLANEPGVDAATGSSARRIGALVRSFLAQYATRDL